MFLNYFIFKTGATEPDNTIVMTKSIKKGGWT